VEGAWFGPRLIFTTTGRHTVTSLLGLAAGSAAHRTPGPLGAWLWRCPRISVWTDRVCVCNSGGGEISRGRRVCTPTHGCVCTRVHVAPTTKQGKRRSVVPTRRLHPSHTCVVAEGRRRRRSRAERAKPPSFDFSRNFDLSRRTRRLLVSPEVC